MISIANIANLDWSCVVNLYAPSRFYYSFEATTEITLFTPKFLYHVYDRVRIMNSYREGVDFIERAIILKSPRKTNNVIQALSVKLAPSI